MASRKNELEEIDSIIDEMSNIAIKALVHQIVGFSCVPYKPNGHWCNSCGACWITYLEWVRDKYNPKY